MSLEVPSGFSSRSVEPQPERRRLLGGGQRDLLAAGHGREEDLPVLPAPDLLAVRDGILSRNLFDLRDHQDDRRARLHQRPSSSRPSRLSASVTSGGPARPAAGPGPSPGCRLAASMAIDLPARDLPLGQPCRPGGRRVPSPGQGSSAWSRADGTWPPRAACRTARSRFRCSPRRSEEREGRGRQTAGAPHPARRPRPRRAAPVPARPSALGRSRRSAPARRSRAPAPGRSSRRRRR